MKKTLNSRILQVNLSLVSHSQPAKVELQQKGLDEHEGFSKNELDELGNQYEMEVNQKSSLDQILDYFAEKGFELRSTAPWVSSDLAQIGTNGITFTMRKYFDHL